MRATHSKSGSIRDVERLRAGRQWEGIEPAHKQRLELEIVGTRTPPQRGRLLTVPAITKTAIAVGYLV
jgi:hypothetical protein